MAAPGAAAFFSLVDARQIGNGWDYANIATLISDRRKMKPEDPFTVKVSY